MSKIKKVKQLQNLAQYQVLIEDTEPNSFYFQLRELGDVLHAGKNAFLIVGSEFLEPTTEVLVELIDANGNPVFTQPIKNYAEGKARVVSIEIYEDTPPGSATLTILGQLRATKDGSRIPNKWKNAYNVRFQKLLTIDPLRVNDSKLRLYETPTLRVTEVLFPFRKAVTGSLTYVSASGASAFGAPLVQTLSGTLDNPYTITTTQFALSKSFEGGAFTASISQSDFVGIYTASIVSVLNSQSMVVNPGLINNSGTAFSIFGTPNFTISFQPEPTFTPTALTRSYADVQLAKLTTFSGEIARAQLYMRSLDQEGDFQLVADQALEEAELTETQSAVLGPMVRMGDFFDQEVITEFWTAGIVQANRPAYVPTASVTLSRDTAHLIDSMYIAGQPNLRVTGSTTASFFMGLAQPLSFYGGLEYVFAANAFCLKDASFDATIEVYLTGSAFPSDNPLGVKLTSFTSPAGQLKSLFQDTTVNFIPTRDGSGSLNFVVYGGEWYVSNVGLFTAKETGFNPDIVRFIIPIQGRRFEHLQFKAQLFDPNHNIFPQDIFSDPVLFNGGNVVLQGTDHRLGGALTLAPSGTGPVLSVDVSGSYIGISNTQTPRPIDISALPSYGGAPIITIYSGSTPYSGSAAGPAIGIQIAGGGFSGSFLDFNTLTGRLTLKGDITLLPGSALSQSIVSGGGNADGTLALQQIQQLVSGNLSGGTFISANSIISPVIGGNSGYFTSQFGVGNIAANGGIVITALGYTASNGIPQSGYPAIYIGSGIYGSASTPFIVASSSAGGLLALGDRLLATSSAGQFLLIVSGALAVQSGSRFVDVRTYVSDISASLAQQEVSDSASLAAKEAQDSASLASQAISFSQSLAAKEVQDSASLASQAISFSQSLAAKEVQDSASLASQALSFSQSQAAANVVDSSNKIKLPVSAKTVPGLYLETSSMGFWQPHPSGNGISQSNFPVVINSDGQFRFAASNSWSGSSTTGFFTQSITFANGNFVIRTQNLVVDTPGLQFAGFAPSSSTNSFIKLGANAPNITLTSGQGFYADGGGNVRFGTDATGSDFLLLQPGNALIVSASNILIGGSGLRIGALSSSIGYVKLGSAGANVTLTNNAGFYADGGGNVRFGTDTTGSDFLLLQPGNALVISSSNFMLSSSVAGNTLQLNPLQFLLGNPAPTQYNPQGAGAKGFYVNRNGQFFVGSGSVGVPGTGSWISFDGTTLTINATASAVAANAVGAQQIQAGSITGDRIAANTITASKLAIQGQGAALNSDPAPTDINSWFAFSGGGSIATVTDGQVGTTTLRSQTNGVFWTYNTPLTPVDPNKTYRVHCWYRKSSTANGTFYLLVHLVDANGNLISGDGTEWYYPVLNVAGSTSWTEGIGIFGSGSARPFPSNARAMTVGVILNYQGTAGYFEAQDIRLEEVLPSTLIKDGSITTNKIQAGSITTDKLNVTSLDAITSTTNTINVSSLLISSGSSLFRTLQHSTQGNAGDTTMNRVMLENDSVKVIGDAGTGSMNESVRIGSYAVPVGGLIQRTTANQGTAAGWTDPDGVSDGTNNLTLDYTLGSTIVTVTDTARLYNTVGDPTAGANVDAYDDNYTLKFTVTANKGTLINEGGPPAPPQPTVTATVYIEYSTDGGTTWTQLQTGYSVNSGLGSSGASQTFTPTVVVPGTPTQLKFRLKLIAQIINTATSGQGSATVKVFNTAWLTDTYPITWSTTSGLTYNRRGLKIFATTDGSNRIPHAYLEPQPSLTGDTKASEGEIIYVGAADPRRNLFFHNGTGFVPTREFLGAVAGQSRASSTLASVGTITIPANSFRTQPDAVIVEFAGQIPNATGTFTFQLVLAGTVIGVATLTSPGITATFTGYAIATGNGVAIHTVIFTSNGVNVTNPTVRNTRTTYTVSFGTNMTLDCQLAGNGTNAILLDYCGAWIAKT